MFELIRPDTHFDFIGKWKYCVAGSIAIILIGAAAIPVLGIRWGIDFIGGTEVQVRFADGVQADEGKIRNAVQSVGVGEPSVVRYGDADTSREFLIRFQSGTEEQGAEQNQVVDRIQKALTDQVGALSVDRVEYVGPKVGAELRRSGVKAMLIAFALILVYVGFRFSIAVRTGRRDRADPRRAGDVVDLAAVRPAVRPPGAGRAARDRRLQHQRHDRDLRPDPRGDGHPHRAGSPGGDQPGRQSDALADDPDVGRHAALGDRAGRARRRSDLPVRCDDGDRDRGRHLFERLHRGADHAAAQRAQETGESKLPPKAKKSSKQAKARA